MCVYLLFPCLPCLLAPFPPAVNCIASERASPQSVTRSLATVQILQLHPKRLSHPLHIRFPLGMLSTSTTSTTSSSHLRSRKRPAQFARHLEHPQRRFLRLLQFLLHRVLLRFEREHGRVFVRQDVEVALGFLRCERDQFRRHQVADRADVLFVVETGEDAVEEFRDGEHVVVVAVVVEAGEGRVEGCVEGFVGALL